MKKYNILLKSLIIFMLLFSSITKANTSLSIKNVDCDSHSVVIEDISYKQNLMNHSIKEHSNMNNCCEEHSNIDNCCEENSFSHNCDNCDNCSEVISNVQILNQKNININKIKIQQFYFYSYKVKEEPIFEERIPPILIS